MSQRIPVTPFHAERFPVKVRRGRTDEKAQETRQPIVRLKKACSVLALVPLLASCASAPLTLAPVGAGPSARRSSERGLGDLQVYSEPEEYYREELSYFPHTDYHVFTADGRHLRRVSNHNTDEDETPAVISLPPGQYLVQAWAEFFGLVRVPVVIKANHLTKVILQPGWNPGTKAARSELVRMPHGYFVGWRAETPRTK